MLYRLHEQLNFFNRGLTSSRGGLRLFQNWFHTPGKIEFLVKAKESFLMLWCLAVFSTQSSPSYSCRIFLPRRHKRIFLLSRSACYYLEVLKSIYIKASTNLFTRQELCYWMIAHTSIDFIPTVHVPKVPFQPPYIFQKKESYVLLFLLLKFQKIVLFKYIYFCCCIPREYTKPITRF